MPAKSERVSAGGKLCRFDRLAAQGGRERAGLIKISGAAGAQLGGGATVPPRSSRTFSPSHRARFPEHFRAFPVRQAARRDGPTLACAAELSNSDRTRPGKRPGARTVAADRRGARRTAKRRNRLPPPHPPPHLLIRLQLQSGA